MTETKTKTSTPGGGEAKESPHQAATMAAMHLRDGISAVALLVHDCWHESLTADRARNAIDWIAEAMDRECDDLHDALDRLGKGARS